MAYTLDYGTGLVASVGQQLQEAARLQSKYRISLDASLQAHRDRQMDLAEAEAKLRQNDWQLRLEQAQRSELRNQQTHAMRLEHDRGVLEQNKMKLEEMRRLRQVEQALAEQYGITRVSLALEERERQKRQDDRQVEADDRAKAQAERVEKLAYLRDKRALHEKEEQQAYRRMSDYAKAYDTNIKPLQDELAGEQELAKNAKNDETRDAAQARVIELEQKIENGMTQLAQIYRTPEANQKAAELAQVGYRAAVEQHGILVGMESEPPTDTTGLGELGGGGDGAEAEPVADAAVQRILRGSAPVLSPREEQMLTQFQASSLPALIDWMQSLAADDDASVSDRVAGEKLGKALSGLQAAVAANPAIAADPRFRLMLSRSLPFVQRRDPQFASRLFGTPEKRDETGDAVARGPSMTIEQGNAAIETLLALTPTLPESPKGVRVRSKAFVDEIVRTRRDWRARRGGVAQGRPSDIATGKAIDALEAVFRKVGMPASEYREVQAVIQWLNERGLALRLESQDRGFRRESLPKR